MEQVLLYLLFITPVGLLLDLIGFVLIILNGHAFFIKSGTDEAPAKGRPGNIYIQHEGPESGRKDRQFFWAMTGAVMVVVGFTFQIVGSIVAISQSGN